MKWCLAVAILVPSSIKLAGITIFDACIYFVLAFALLKWLKFGFSWKINNGVETALYCLLILVLFSYLYNYSSFEAQKSFVESMGMSTDFLFGRLSIYGLMTLLMLIGVYRIVSSYALSENNINSIVNVLLVSGSINAVITIGAWFVQTGGVFDRYNYMPPLEESQGIHLNYMSLVFLIAFALWTSGAISRTKKMGLIVTMALTGFSILTVMVRQGWIMFIISLLLYLGLSWKNLASIWRLRATVLLIVFLAGGLYFAITQYQGIIQEQFAEIFDSAEESDFNQGSVLMRLSLLEHAYDLFKTHPVIGIGYGHYPAYSTASIIVTGQEKFVSSPHNGILTIAAEMGIVGLFFYFCLCTYIISDSLATVRYADTGIARNISAAILSLIVVSIVSQFISNSTILPLPTERSITQSSFILWFLIGLVVNIKNRIVKSNEMFGVR